MPRRSILPTHTRCLFAALALLLPNGSPAWAIWAPVPLEILIDESVLIVVGKVTKIERAGFAVGDRTMDVAIVEVAETLKKLPHVNNPKQIRILQPAAGGSAISTDLRYAVGQAGIWLLAMQQDGKAYVIRHPSQFQPLEEKPKLVEQIATRQKLSGGKPIDGLQARAELVEHQLAGGPKSFETRLSLKNVSDKPLLLFDYVGARPLTALWFGPEGKELPSKHYAWLKRADLAPANDGNFITLPPGGVHFIGPQSRESGLFFAPLSAQPGAGENLAKPGQHRVVLGYAQQNSATDLGRPGVWKGKVLANELTFTVE